MIVHINGHPGVGKLTIARELVALIGGRLLDNHSIYNVALALTERKSEPYFRALRGVRKIAFDPLPFGSPGFTPILWIFAALTIVSRHATESS